MRPTPGGIWGLHICHRSSIIRGGHADGLNGHRGVREPRQRTRRSRRQSLGTDEAAPGRTCMTMTMVDSPLLRMVQTTPTEYWNDSCAVDELTYAVERGATGGTSNPPIVLEVFKKNKAHWVPRVRELATANPTWSEVELTWAIVEEMAARGAGILYPVFDRTGGRHGRLSVQTNPANHT